MPLSVNIGGVWKSLNNMFVNIGGVWKNAAEVFVNINGVWKSAWTAKIYWLFYGDSGGDAGMTAFKRDDLLTLTSPVGTNFFDNMDSSGFMDIVATPLGVVYAMYRQGAENRHISKWSAVPPFTSISTFGPDYDYQVDRQFISFDVDSQGYLHALVVAFRYGGHMEDDDVDYEYMLWNASGVHQYTEIILTLSMGTAINEAFASPRTYGDGTNAYMVIDGYLKKYPVKPSVETRIWQVSVGTTINAMEVDQNGDIWYSKSDGKIYKLSNAGGSPSIIVSQYGSVGLRQIVVDKNYLYLAYGDYVRKYYKNTLSQSTPIWECLYSDATYSVQGIAVDVQGYVFTARGDANIDVISPAGVKIGSRNASCAEAYGVHIEPGRVSCFSAEYP